MFVSCEGCVLSGRGLWDGPVSRPESTWNVMAHGDAREGKWRGNWWMEWVASTLHTTSERGVASITTADAHTSAASRRLIWRPCLFKWTCPFRRKTKPGFCACAITFQTQSTTSVCVCATECDKVCGGIAINYQTHTHTHTDMCTQHFYLSRRAAWLLLVCLASRSVHFAVLTCTSNCGVNVVFVLLGRQNILARWVG